MKKERETVIQPSVFTEAEAIFGYIKQNSPKNAEKFKNELINLINKVEDIPESYPPEKFLNSKKNRYRFALLMKSWKLIFKTTNKYLIFIGIVHTSRHPKEIRKLRTTDFVE